MKINNILITWHKEHARTLPWTAEKNPYKIWISEIILQQTRVEQAKSYYLSFISEFPTVKILANAPLDQVLRLWQGLGYYTRAANMHATAKQVVNQYHGTFPNSIQELSQLKGIGPYTAAAIAAFAFDAPVVALDGNAFRIFARLFAQDVPIETPAARELFSNIAKDCMMDTPSSLFNQALMDFGSLVCTPKPKCYDCPLSSHCMARLQNRVMEFPVKGVKKAPRNRYFYFLHITHQAPAPPASLLEQGLCDTFILQRRQKDIWRNLYQFPLIETPAPVSLYYLPRHPEWNVIFKNHTPQLIGYSPKYIHRLTHQVLHTYFIRIHIQEESEWLQRFCKRVPASSLDQYGVPRLLERYLLQEPIKYLPLQNADLLD